jgi:2-oxo-4-hydroxy-4-carboxy-5-ureidoimidazoline decarboxylase
VRRMKTAQPVLSRWNALDVEAAENDILPCCASVQWARAMTLARPIADEKELFQLSDEIWMNLAPSDWAEAFGSHPRIGERNADVAMTRPSVTWSRQEQKGTDVSSAEILAALAHGNEVYEKKFGRVFLVCATGKSAEEMLASLERRLRNDSQTELREAVEQQRQITRLRLQKWLDKA